MPLVFLAPFLGYALVVGRFAELGGWFFLPVLLIGPGLYVRDLIQDGVS